MKKLFIAIFLTLFSVNSFAQVKFGNGALGDYDVKINVETQNDSICLHMTYRDEHCKLAGAPKLLLKLFDDSIIELAGKNLSEVTKNEGGYVVSGVMFSENIYIADVNFPITKDQMESLKKGVKKIRINSSPKYREKEWENDKIGKKLYKDYEKSSSNSFQDNF
jgi:hypothetical protein